MDFENAKENIQPLAAGRNASILHASLCVESPQELLARRRELEKSIQDYAGNDPLEPWYVYISWIEQSFPSGGKESGLEEVLTKCLSRFENEERYFQDRRMIKLYMKFIDSHQQPVECYQQLFNAGIGTMVADFYICWAYHYDSVGNTRKADEIFRRGIACRAQPFEELQEAHQHFGFSVAQRLMYQDDEDVKENTKRQFEERRLALTSLRGLRGKSTVGSIRTGAAVKSYVPGTVQSRDVCSSKPGNARVHVFHDENASLNMPPPITVTPDSEQENATLEDPKSVVRSIIDAARNQENLKEPGPWNKAHNKKKSGKLFPRSERSTDIGFSIHEDVEMEYSQPLRSPITEGDLNHDKPFKYPQNFRNKNLPQKEWLTPVTIENQSDPRTFPQYKKSYLYPRPNMEFQTEEYRAYCWYQKHDISNEFTAKREHYWCNGIAGNVRQYPNFSKQSIPQVLDKSDVYFEPEKAKGMVVCFSKMYDTAEKVEYQWEELMAKRLHRNNTILMTADMDETACEIGERGQRRKSFFPLRKSMAPKPTMTATKLVVEGNVAQSKPGSELKEPEFCSKEREPVVIIPYTEEISKDPGILTVPVGKSVLPFEIFEDTTRTNTTTDAIARTSKELAVYQEQFLSPPDVDFMFKTPALPAATSSASVIPKTITTNKLSFEIYTEPSLVEPPPMACNTEGTAGGSLFDPEETCSTQTFNICIKSQSVSTPKMAQKVAPRQFGSILKSIPNSPEILSSPECSPSIEPNVDEPENGSKDAPEYSPLLVKQLSTILETSEHGTTQGTHTTGGTTTKSSSSASEGESERELVTRLLIPHIELEPLVEQSHESTTVPPEVIASMKNINIQDDTSNTLSAVTTEARELPYKQLVASAINTLAQATPGNIRLQAVADVPTIAAAPATALNVSIFDDERTEGLKVKQAGNFTRIDEPEDTAAGYAIRSVRFQEDKTETIPKMLLNSRSIVKFQEDKTETLPKIPLAQVVLTQFEVEKTDTMPKIQLEPPNVPTVKNVSANLDDSFEFFGQTPPGKSILHPRFEVSAFKDCMEARTPVAKRQCNVKTPEYMKAPRSTQKQSITSSTNTAKSNFKGPAIFEDELDKISSKEATGTFSSLNVQKAICPSVPAVHRVIPRESFMPEFSFIEESQPQPAVIASKINPPTNDNAHSKWIPTNFGIVDTNSEKDAAAKSSQVLHESAAKRAAQRNVVQEQQAKSDLGDSYLKDFSEIKDSQPGKSDSKWHRSASKAKLTDAQKTKANDSISNSFLKDFSAVMESQPTKKEIECQQSKSITNKGMALTKRNDEENAKYDLGNAYLRNFSQPVETEREREQAKSAGNKELAGQQKSVVEIKKIEIGNSFLQDYSLVMESQPVVSERHLGQKRSLSSSATTKLLSTMPEVSQQKLQENNPELAISYLKDFSFVPESQPLESSKLWQKNKTPSNQPSTAVVHQNLNPPILINDSYLKDFSIALEAPTLASATKRSQEQLKKLTLESASSAPAKPLIFLDSFMKDFSGFQGSPADLISTKKCSTRLTFVNDSRKLNDPKHAIPQTVNTNKESITISSAPTPNKLHFLDKCRPSLALPPLSTRFSKSFELNAETAMFSTNISMIKNSTLLPYNESTAIQAPTPIKEQSLQIKVGDLASAKDDSNQLQDAFKTPPASVNKQQPVPPKVLSQSSVAPEKPPTNSTGAVPKVQSATKKSYRDSKIPQPLSNFKTPAKGNAQLEEIVVMSAAGDDAEEADAEMSIYFKHTPKTPKIQQHIWNEKSPSPKTPSQNVYVHREVDLNVTNQIIDNIHEDSQVNPFNSYLQNAFLEQMDFSNYIEKLPSCKLVGHVSRLNNTSRLKVGNVEFDVLKLVGEGAYGAVYSGVNNKTGEKYALKQERPPNFWEYYVCLEVHSRLNSDDLFCAFMSIDYALIGNNSSILISPFSVHGSLITVCNQVKKHTLRNVDEYVVMLLTCELLSIIDHLHAIDIIHADIKPDNFILMKNLDYHSTQYSLQLIDFGVSIDMQLFKPGQTFNYVHNENAFKCVEMREGRPWTYQLDLYGLAGVIHVLLFGKFMDIAQRANDIWMHKTHVPRYINRSLWDTIFQSLLNVRDCGSMPNLQNLRALIKGEISEKEKFVLRKVAEFNSALNACN